MRWIVLTLAITACASAALAQPTDWVQHYHDRVRAFEGENRTLDPAQEYVVLVGDSLTEGWRYSGRVASYLPTSGGRVLNRGIVADGVGSPRGVLNRMDASVFDCQPSHVFLLVGVNRIGPNGQGVTRTAQRYEQVVTQIRQRLPGAVLCVVTSTPTRGAYANRNGSIRLYNTKLKEIAQRHGLPVIDLHGLVVGADGQLPASMTGDGLHFNSRGYAIWGREIERVVASGGGAGLPLPPLPPTLRRGDRGDDVRALQVALNAVRAAMGLPAIGVDGIFGGQTHRAVRSFQSREGLGVDGVAGPQTHGALRRRGAIGALNGGSSGGTTSVPASSPTLRSGGPTLRRGSRHGDVGHLQARLNDARIAAGLSPISVDGAFGPNTETAVRAFQASAGRGQTGVVDAATWNALVDATDDGPLGRINAAAYPRRSDTYRRTYSSTKFVGIHALEPLDAGDDTSRPLVFESGMAIDADGAGGAWRGDPDGQPSTSLSHPGGRALNPTTLNFFVLPIGFDSRHPGVRLGDVAAVVYRGRVAYAIYGDRGPRSKLGEGSIALARALGINSSPTRGGVGGGVTYVVFPGSGTGRPLTQAQIDDRASALLRRAGGNP